MKRNKCRGCKSKKLEKFLDLGNMPLAGGFLSSVEKIKDEKLFPLPIYVCRDCCLVQILDLIDPEILFQDYSFSSSTIDPLRKHFEDYAKWLKNNLHPKLVVEFGCNDGVLLTPLEKLDIKACGVDISQNITEMARSKDLDVLTGYFDEQIAKNIKERLGQADVVTGSNAFAHNDKPEIILKAAGHLLKPNGYLCLEVMYAGDLFDMLQWDTLYHEHLNFYSLHAISILLKRYNFHVINAERIPMHGGSIRIVATQDTKAPINPSVEEILTYERKKLLSDPDTWVEFGGKIGRKIKIVRDTLNKLSENSRIWGYGAAGKATLWVNACQMDYLEAMVDASPLRAGKLMPGTHTPIVFPKELKANPPDYIFVTAWNYAELIRSKEEWFKGTWVTPLPDMIFF